MTMRSLSISETLRWHSSEQRMPVEYSVITMVRRIRFSAESIRSEEHTSELQSLRHLVCRLLLEKKSHWGAATPDRHQCISRPARSFAAAGWAAGGGGRERDSDGANGLDLRHWCFFFFLNNRAPPKFSPFPPPGSLRI